MFLYKKTRCFFSEKPIKLKNTICVQDLEFLMLKLVVYKATTKLHSFNIISKSKPQYRERVCVFRAELTQFTYTAILTGKMVMLFSYNVYLIFAKNLSLK